MNHTTYTYNQRNQTKHGVISDVLVGQALWLAFFFYRLEVRRSMTGTGAPAVNETGRELSPILARNPTVWVNTAYIGLDFTKWKKVAIFTLVLFSRASDVNEVEGPSRQIFFCLIVSSTNQSYQR